MRDAAGLHAEQEPGCEETVGTGEPGASTGAAQSGRAAREHSVAAPQCLVFTENCVPIRFHAAARKDAWSWEMIKQ